MYQADQQEEIPLSTGQSCILYHHPVGWLRGYHVLFFPPAQGEATEEEIDEMLSIASRKGRECALRYFGDPDNYMLLYHGPAMRRRATAHIHIFPLRHRWHKTYLYLLLFMRNLLRQP